MSRLLITFVGQCHTVGYAGVPADAAFPQVCREVVQASRPGRRVEVRTHPYYHPAELMAAVEKALRDEPRVVVIEVVGWLAVRGTSSVDLSRLPNSVRTAYDRMRHFRHAKAVVRHIPRAAEPLYQFLKPLLPRHPRPSVAEYESSLRQALESVGARDGVQAVVQGPGAPNLDLNSRELPSDALERYRAVHEMSRRVAEERKALYVDRWDTVTRGFYPDGGIRPTARAHSVWGHLLGAELLRAGVV